MPFEPGNQLAKNRQSPKPWADALRLAVSEAHAKGGNKLRALAEKTVAEGLAGNINAIREIADRLDGKVTQPHEHGGTPDSPINLNATITIIDPRSESSAGVQAALDPMPV